MARPPIIISNGGVLSELITTDKPLMDAIKDLNICKKLFLDKNIEIILQISIIIPRTRP